MRKKLRLTLAVALGVATAAAVGMSLGTFNAIAKETAANDCLVGLQGDLDGRMWLAFRHRTCRRPRADGWAIQARWDVYATAFLGDRWLTPVELPASVGRNDMRIDSQRDPQGNVYFAFASDNRPWQLPQMPPRWIGSVGVRFCVVQVAPPSKVVAMNRYQMPMNSGW